MLGLRCTLFGQMSTEIFGPFFIELFVFMVEVQEFFILDTRLPDSDLIIMSPILCIVFSRS